MVPDVGMGRNIPDIVPGRCDSRRAGVAVVRQAGQQKITKWSSGFCTICKKGFHMVTFAHAAKHGYDDPTRMAREADFLIWNHLDTRNAWIKRKGTQSTAID